MEVLYAAGGLLVGWLLKDTLNQATKEANVSSKENRTNVPARVQELLTRAASRREQQEAAAAELCDLLEVDPDSDDGDDLKSCVYDGQPLDYTLRIIIARKKRSTT